MLQNGSEFKLNYNLMNHSPSNNNINNNGIDHLIIFFSAFFPKKPLNCYQLKLCLPLPAID
jgi:hypothetical protein